MALMSSSVEVLRTTITEVDPTRTQTWSANSEPRDTLTLSTRHPWLLLQTLPRLLVSSALLTFQFGWTGMPPAAARN
jgi:hypothetical protein